MLNWEAIKTALKLFLITAVSALCLALVNKVTAPVIAENQEIVTENTQKELIPDADKFVDSQVLSLVEINSADGSDVESLFTAMKGDKVIGHIVTVISKNGYGGDIKLMVGINDKSQITKVKITETHETAGLGLKASNSEFIDQFIGRSNSLSVIKNSPPIYEGTDVSAISGATVTSKAVTEAVNKALEVVRIGKNITEVISEETEKQIKED